MTDELTLYRTDRKAWIERASRRVSDQFQALSGDELSMRWSFMGRDFQTAVWSHLNETQRARVRALRGEK